MISCEKEAATTSKQIGIVLFGDSRQEQVNGFKDGLKELGIQDQHINYHIRNAKNDRSKLKILVKELIDKKVDLLVAAGGLEADTMKKMMPNDYSIPVVVLYVNAIIERGLVKDRKIPGWEVTGVDNLNAELSGKRVQILHELFPQSKKILILYYERIAPSRIGVEKAKEIAKLKNIQIDARAVNSREEIAQVMASLKPGEVDAMLTVPTAPIDNALKKIILPHVNRLKIPLMTHSRPLAELGGFASYGAHFYDIGKQASRLAFKVLKNVNAGNIPFEVPKKFVFTVNKNVMDDMGFQLNEVSKAQINELIVAK